MLSICERVNERIHIDIYSLTDTHSSHILILISCSLVYAHSHMSIYYLFVYTHSDNAFIWTSYSYVLLISVYPFTYFHSFILPVCIFSFTYTHSYIVIICTSSFRYTHWCILPVYIYLSTQSHFYIYYLLVFTHSHTLIHLYYQFIHTQTGLQTSRHILASNYEPHFTTNCILHRKLVI